MKIEDMESARLLKVERDALQGFYMKLLHWGQITDARVWWEPNGKSEAVPNQLYEQLMTSLLEASTRAVAEVDAALLKLGVRTTPMAVSDDDAKGWREWATTLRLAWTRELGGKLFNKHHLIDGLVKTTRWMRERSDMLGHAETVLRDTVSGNRTPAMDQLLARMDEHKERYP